MKLIRLSDEIVFDSKKWDGTRESWSDLISFCEEENNGIDLGDLLLETRLLRHSMNIGDFLYKKDGAVFLVRKEDIGIIYNIVNK